MRNNKNYYNNKGNKNNKRNFRLYRKTPSINYMKELFNKSGFNLNDDEYKKIWEFHQLLRTHNSELDLTRLRGFEDIVIKHYIDSTIILKFIKLPSPILDIGSGAGFPGIPLKIISPETHIILGEPRWKRCQFIREVIDKLNLNNIEVYERKVRGNFPNEVQGVITRAFESITKTLKRSSDFLREGGQAIFMKGPSVDPEIKEANEVMKDKYILIKDIKYTIKGTPHKRRLVIYSKL